MKKVVDGVEERREVEEKRRGRIGGFPVDTTFWKVHPWSQRKELRVVVASTGQALAPSRSVCIAR